MEYIFATLVVFAVSVGSGEQTNVRIVLESKITAQECVDIRQKLIEINSPMEAHIVEPGWEKETILFHPKNLVCEPFIES